MAGAARPFAEFLSRKTTLYLNSRSGEVRPRGAGVILQGDRRLPLAEVRRVVLVGRANAGPALLYNLMKAGVSVDWLDLFGRPIGLLTPTGEDVDSGLMAQAAFAESAGALALAKSLILAKVDNQYEVLRRRTPKARILRQNRAAIANARSPASLRGFEGEAAREYFQSWKDILHDFNWKGRVAHPAPDPVNALLSAGYGLLRNRLASALRHAGLNPRLSFFHESRGRHAALASDLMEPLRPLVDARVLSLIRRREIRPEAFGERDGRCVYRDRNTFSLVMEEFENSWAETHKFYVNPEDNAEILERSVNDILDDLAESFAAHIRDGRGCIAPRLAPCATV